MNTVDGIVFNIGDVTFAMDLANDVDCTTVVAVRHNPDGTMTVIGADEFYIAPTIEGECRRIE